MKVFVGRLWVAIGTGGATWRGDHVHTQIDPQAVISPNTCTYFSAIFMFCDICQVKIVVHSDSDAQRWLRIEGENL